jgi:hypothetical protein
MSRRAAAVTQADVARVARVARDLGPGWLVEVEGGVIRLLQGESPAADGRRPDDDPEPPDDGTGRGLDFVP